MGRETAPCLYRARVIVRMSWGYITAFWTTVVMNCVQPVNWEACLPIQNWLFPAVHDYIRFRTEEPYASERRALRLIQRNDGLDGGGTKP